MYLLGYFCFLELFVVCLFLVYEKMGFWLSVIFYLKLNCKGESIICSSEEYGLVGWFRVKI